jgi:hypothetical protein
MIQPSRCTSRRARCRPERSRRSSSDHSRRSSNHRRCRSSYDCSCSYNRGRPTCRPSSHGSRSSCRTCRRCTRRCASSRRCPGQPFRDGDGAMGRDMDWRQDSNVGAPDDHIWPSGIYHAGTKPWTRAHRHGDVEGQGRRDEDGRGWRCADCGRWMVCRGGRRWTRCCGSAMIGDAC